MKLEVFDDVLPDPWAYRQMALAQRYGRVKTPNGVFRGIASCVDPIIPNVIAAWHPELVTTLSFFRRSPAGQHEPTYLHTDEEMGDWTAIVYLNPEPPEGDGTSFWVEGADHGWTRTHHVAAQFGRLALFAAHQPHSRGLFENYGAIEDESARLVQILFGRGVPVWP